MIDSATSVRFPAQRFVSKTEFDEYCRENQGHLDARYALELEYASADPTIICAGTCAPCLRSTRFEAQTVGGEEQPGGRYLPHWREALTCDCEDRLGNRPRAMLHYLESVAGAQPWMRALLFGAPTLSDRRVEALVASAVAVEQLGKDHLLPIATASVHLVVASDALQRVPPLDAALAEIRRVLLPGGQFAFTVPFRYHSAGTRSFLDHVPTMAGRLPAETPGDCHEIGWDILTRLRRAGFAEASAYVYWSRELGYFGPFNFMFGAVA